MQPAKTLEEVIPNAVQLLEAIAAASPGSAYDSVNELLAMPRTVFEAVEAERLRQMTDAGPRAGCEWVDSCLMGASLLRCVYLEKFERGPIFWSLTWYFNSKVWRVTSASVFSEPATLETLLPARTSKA